MNESTKPSKKLYQFLIQLDSIPNEQRALKIDEINSSKKYQSSIGEMTLEILEKVENDDNKLTMALLYIHYDLHDRYYDDLMVYDISALRPI